MSTRRIRALMITLVIVLGSLGSVLLSTGTGAFWGPLLWVIGAVIAVVGIVWGIVTGIAQGNWQFLEWMNPLDWCCSFVGVLGVTSLVTIGGFLLWQSLLVATLAGGSIMTLMLLVFSLAAALSKGESQSSLSKYAGTESKGIS